MNDNWRDHAACQGLTHLFYAETGENCHLAKAICNTICPVREQCEEAGRNEHHGIWGGLSEDERHGSRRRHTHPLTPIIHGTVAGYRAHYRRGIPLCPECRQASALFHGQYRKRKLRLVVDNTRQGVA